VAAEVVEPDTRRAQLQTAGLTADRIAERIRTLAGKSEG
jgi:hypothetical protein